MVRFVGSARLIGCNLVLSALAGPLVAQITLFPIPTAGSRPYTIVAGPDGNLWFTESTGNKIGRITPAGTITEFPVQTPGSGPYGIAVGPDGNIWFTERFGNQIGKLDLSNFQITEYPIPTGNSQPWEICAGANGSMWFTEDEVAQIGAITMAGQIVEFTSVGCCFPIGIAAGPGGNIWYTIEIGDQIGEILPNNIFTQFQIQSVQVLPWDIAAGPDGNMWFTELAGRAVGQITPTGVITEFPIAGNFSGIAGITAGSDGNLYFTENDTHLVSGMTLAGTVFQTLPTTDRPLSICNGPDGNIWFTVADANKIGRWAIAQPGTNHVLSMDAGFSPTLRNASLGETVQWTFNGPNVHSVTDASGMGLFASGPKNHIDYFTHTFPAAGAYVYKDISPVYRRGGINVRVVVPATGNVGVPFQVQWASPGVPPGFIEDVIVLTPGAPSYVPWVSTTVASAPYVPAVAGDYLFRARLRNQANGKACVYSRPSSVTVN